MYYSGQRPDDDGSYYNLGAFGRPVSTHSVGAQRWFSRGLIWCYAFNHEEAAACFRLAIAADVECAMAYWGLAYALGPNYNKPWQFFDNDELVKVVEESKAALDSAGKKATAASGAEKALIEALKARYPGDGAAGTSEALDDGYAKAMEPVYHNFPDDLDVMALYVDALMNLTPWKLWDLRTGEPADGARTLEAKEILEKGLAKDAYHPGLLHLYIHLMEMSGHPERALRWADNLRGLVPDAGHLNHMPTHLDVLCGDYRRAIDSNSQAIESDKRFLSRSGALNFYSLYRCHNYHFRIYAAMFAGQSAVAIATAEELASTLPEELLRIPSPPMADWLEGFLAMRVHVSIRFGRWSDILSLSLPSDPELYSTTTAMIHYAKGVAHASTGKIPEAEEEQRLFQDAVARVPSSRTVFNNTCTDILAVAGAMLAGELDYRKGNLEEAFTHLRQAIALDDALPYDEPWGWMQPTRHAYGALLLEQGRVEDALEAYEADLGFSDVLPRALQRRNNVWSLHGYHECLERLGRTSEARIIKPQLDLALAFADVEIESSCFCRRR
ncbi:TPR domain protein [Immersiella caudata]|uniref:TPR domain protein n=1 Tax=Immersiella caudata TaxID=314043 RepID=A0AA40CCY9_9PEZI|nr:TPR domain protein [Immersiella caudata]